MKNNLLEETLVKRIFAESGLPRVGKATIREIKKLSDTLEKASGVHFIHMEMGNPGLPAAKVGIDAQIEALKKGVPATYPDIDGVPAMRQEASRFIKNFIDIDIKPENCLATVGSMQGAFSSFMICSRVKAERTTTLFIDPCFPVHKFQNKVLGIPVESFDIYDFRGEKLRGKLEEILSKGHIHSILYSNPNNPSWVCLTAEELKIIGEVCRKYDVIVIEDLAYFGMDFRKDYGHPGVPPFQPSVGKYADDYILLVSSSKAFSYAGERVAVMAISDHLAARKYPDLKRFYSSEVFRNAVVYGALHPLSSGASHSAQYAMAALFKAANDGVYNFREEVMEYGRKARAMKDAFLAAGFEITYDKDLDEDVADGFYFTYGYPGMTGAELLEEMLYYGISAISLDTCGSTRQGIRACTSLIAKEDIPELARRLLLFHEDHPLD